MKNCYHVPICTLAALMLGGLLFVGCSSNLSLPDTDSNITSIDSTDIAAIKQQLRFDTQGHLALSEEAKNVLTKAQLELAQVNIEASNIAVSHGDWEFADEPSNPLIAVPRTAQTRIWWCFTKIASASWFFNDPYQSLKVGPTTCGRITDDLLSTWVEIVKKAPSSIYWNRNDSNQNSSMFNQFACHYYAAFWKSYWDLEPARPNVGFIATVGARCNPGGGPL
jgi:outer membrane murein-binding lipoprotein Lpp